MVSARSSQPPAIPSTAPPPPPSSAQAVSATKQGGEKDARLQYLSWRIWFMRRRRAEVQRARGGLPEDESAPHSAGYTTEEEEVPAAASIADHARGRAEGTDVAPAVAAGLDAAPGDLLKPKKQLSVKIGAAAPAAAGTGAHGAI